MSISITTRKGAVARKAPAAAADKAGPEPGAEDIVSHLRAWASDAVCDGIDPAGRCELPPTTHLERGGDRDVA